MVATGFDLARFKTFLSTLLTSEGTARYDKVRPHRQASYTDFYTKLSSGPTLPDPMPSGFATADAPSEVDSALLEQTFALSLPTDKLDTAHAAFLSDTHLKRAEEGVTLHSVWQTKTAMTEGQH